MCIVNQSKMMSLNTRDMLLIQCISFYYMSVESKAKINIGVKRVHVVSVESKAKFCCIFFCQKIP